MPGGSLPARWEPLRKLQPEEINPDAQRIWAATGLTSGNEVWINDRYQVVVRYPHSICSTCRSEHPDVKRDPNCEDEFHDREEPTGPDGLVWLSIHAHDRGPMRNWRHLQQMKNEVCGPERWAVEVFPAESSLTDSANEYHLFVMPEGADIPFAFHEHLVSNDEQVEEYNADESHRGRQEPWEEGLTTGRMGPSARNEKLDECGALLSGSAEPSASS